MATEFWIYSTDASPESNPATASIKVQLDDPPILNGEYDNFGDAEARGSVHRTFGGIVVQDFGILDTDRTIRITGTDALSQATVDALQSMYAAVATQYYFSDGYERFLVQFSRKPAGLRYWRNLGYAHNGRPYFTYEINLIVLDKRA